MICIIIARDKYGIAQKVFYDTETKIAYNTNGLVIIQRSELKELIPESNSIIDDYVLGVLAGLLYLIAEWKIEKIIHDKNL